jgi:hypothetical protein
MVAVKAVSAAGVPVSSPLVASASETGFSRTGCVTFAAGVESSPSTPSSLPPLSASSVVSSLSARSARSA